MRPLLALCLVTLAAGPGCRSDGLTAGQKTRRIFLGYNREHDLHRLHSSDAHIRRWAVIRLGRNADPLDATAIAALLDPHTEPAPLVRAAALAALRAIGDTRQLPPLRRACSDPELHIRLLAIRTLGDLGDENDIPLLAAKLAAAQDPDVRLEAALALMRLGHDTAVPALAAALADPDQSVRFAAHTALQKITGANLPPTPEAWLKPQP